MTSDAMRFNSTVPIQAIERLTENSLKDEIYAFLSHEPVSPLKQTRKTVKS